MHGTKKKHKYFHQLFFTYSIAFLLFITLLFAAVLGWIYKEQFNRNKEVQYQFTSKIQSRLDSSLESMDRIINGLLFNRTFLDIMEDSKNTSALPEYDTQMLNYFLTLDAPELSTYRIIAFNDDVYYTLTKSDENPAYIKNAISNYPWSNSLKDAGGERVILPIHKDNFSTSQETVYSVARQITDGSNPYGFIEVQNEFNNIESFCSLKHLSGEIMVFASDGTQIYPDPSVKGAHSQKFMQETFSTVSRRKETDGSFRDNRAQITYVTSSYSGWTTVMYCPLTEMVPWGLQMILFSLLVFLFLIATVLIMFRVLTKRLVAPLNDLSHALEDVSLENLSLKLDQQYNIEEIEIINQSFQKMFEHLKNAINISMQSKTNEERANYLALQSQMNPHTIYNTISMIEGVAYMNGDKEVSELCIRFSKMLRYISDYTKDTYTIQDEVSHLQNYAFLIQKRYDGKLNIHIGVQEDIQNELLPKFTLQPLVENCVKHGLHSTNPCFIVDVSIDSAEEYWVICIADNGSGFTPVSLQKISKQLIQCDESLKNQQDIINRKIGNLTISNIYIRCRILYGDRFHFDFGNNPGSEGAYIKIKVAKQRRGKKS